MECKSPDLRSDLYVSGTTIFTLGLGDVTPRSPASRELIIFEAGTGLGFLAVVMGYFPVLYSAFSRREVSISLLDARAGSPPTAAELMRRHSYEGAESDLSMLLVEWERWSAELLESHISYPLLCYFRSQHTHQSWIGALTAMLDTSALLIAGVRGHEARQAQLTFAMARHALVDLAQIFSLPPKDNVPDRLPPERYRAALPPSVPERRQHVPRRSLLRTPPRNARSLRRLCRSPERVSPHAFAALDHRPPEQGQLAGGGEAARQNRSRRQSLDRDRECGKHRPDHRTGSSTSTTSSEPT